MFLLRTLLAFVFSLALCSMALAETVTPEWAFSNATLKSSAPAKMSVWECLRYVTSPLHTTETYGGGSCGLNVVFFGTEEEGGKLVSLPTEAMTVTEAVSLICKQAGLQFRFDNWAVLIGRDIPNTDRQQAVFETQGRETEKLWESLHFSHLEFDYATIQETTDFISYKAKTLRPDEPSLKFAFEKGAPTQPRVILSSYDMTAAQLVHYLSLICHLDYRLGPDGVIFSPKALKETAKDPKPAKKK